MMRNPLTNKPDNIDNKSYYYGNVSEDQGGSKIK